MNITIEQEVLLLLVFLLSLAYVILKLTEKDHPFVDELDQSQKEDSKVHSANIQQEHAKEDKEELKPVLIVNEKPATDFSQGLVQSRGFLISKLTAWLGSNKKLDQSNAIILEEILIGADLGVQTSQQIVNNVLANAKLEKSNDLMFLLRHELVNILKSEHSPEINLDNNVPTIILIVGVNGAGKTTTIAKISKLFKAQGKRVLVAAADTFRAAAIEQLSHWAERVGVDIEYKEGENIKPATVVYDAISRLRSDKHDVLIIDTAGRLHNRVNLMNELESIKKSIQREFPDAPHETLLVLDGSSGQNALQQAREFNGRVPLTGIVITKLDGTSKGGIVVAIRDELKVDIRFIGLGEKEDDLLLFNPDKYVKALLGEGELKIEQDNLLEQNSEIEIKSEPQENTLSERKVVRKRRS